MELFMSLIFLALLIVFFICVIINLGKDFWDSQNLNLTFLSESAIIIPEGEGKHHKPERNNAHE